LSEMTDLFRRLSQGVYVVAVAANDRRDGFTAAWVMQVSFDPLLLALSVNPDNASYELLHEGGGFTVNVLKQEQLDLARRFGTRSGRSEDKLQGVRWTPGRTGAPILQEGLAYFDCELIGRHRAGDHELVLGRVVDGKILDPTGTPLTYSDTGDMDGSAGLYPRKF
jgi:flavin reductase (DIM6/NTAB) family NADH-FMN oxidoreductase RutF